VTPLTPVLLAAIAIGTTAALLAWRERPEPGAVPLTILLVGQCWWSASLIFQLQATTLEAKIIWVNVSWIGVVLIPVAWMLFALEYTGRDQYIRPRYVGLLSFVPAITVLLALTGPYHDLFYVDSHLIEQGGRLAIHRTPGPWYWIIAGYTYLLGLLGAIPLLGLLTSESIPFRGQGTALLAGTIVPWLTNILFLAGLLPTGSVDPTPIAFAISGVAYLGALTRFRLFGTSPSPTRRARRLVFERMHEGAIVLDSHGHLVDMNDEAVTLLGVSPRAVLGRPVADVIPEYESGLDDGSSAHITIRRDGRERQYEVKSTRLEDRHDRFIGRVVTFHDISTYLRQQQRLKVLNRVLRHNIRTETNLIHGYAENLASETDANELGKIKRHALRIEELGQKSRDVIKIFDKKHEQAEQVSLDDTLSHCIESIRRDFPQMTIEYHPADTEVRVDNILEPVLSNAVENAAQHNDTDDPHAWVETEVIDGRVRITVADDGPGIDEPELQVLEGGTETSLEHASALGLWLITWGTEIANGTVRFSERDPTGTVVTIEVPIRTAG